jgi:hypothetical protein
MNTIYAYILYHNLEVLKTNSARFVPISFQILFIKLISNDYI